MNTVTPYVYPDGIVPPRSYNEPNSWVVCPFPQLVPWPGQQDFEDVTVDPAWTDTDADGDMIQEWFVDICGFGRPSEPALTQDQFVADLREYVAENPDADKLPELLNDLDYDGAVHEIVDGSVPIYTQEIEDTWYLHAVELENAGVGDNPRENNGMAAIYFYIEQEISEWWEANAQDIFDEWYEVKHPGKEDE